MSILLCNTVASAQTEPPEERPGAARKALNTAAAVVPGLLVHGSGHFVAGDFQTGKRLLGAQGAGMLLAVGGIAGLAVTGAAPSTSSPLIASAIAGTGLFTTSALADLYGVVAPRGGFGVAAAPPRLSVAAGYTHVDNPTFEHNHLTHLAAEIWFSTLRLAPAVWIAADDANWRAQLAVSWRMLGWRERTEGDGSFVEMGLGYNHHRFGNEGFSEHTAQLSLAARLDLARVSPSLSGAFTEWSLGVAYGAYAYDNLTTEPTDMLLGGFAFGSYLGHTRGGWGEIKWYYDHRHDGYAGGLKAVGLGSGAPGHFGVRLDTQFVGPWGLNSELQAGSALVASLLAVYRMGGGR